MANISWLYYKDYFNGIRFDVHKFGEDGNNIKLVKAKNIKITKAKLTVIENPCAKQRIKTFVQYPGLVTGIGINHEASIQEEFKLGLHFDYTYGMPVIYGSSVKGLLRSAFPESEEVIEKEKDPAKNDKLKKLRNSKTSIIKNYLGKGFENIDVDKLRAHIFDGIKNIKEDNTIEYFSIYERDVFFDAVIIKPNKKNMMLASDSITPHKNNPLQEPVPITFLKIASGCTLEFRFDLKPSTIDGIEISAACKLALFKNILRDFGIGAKTNVGYGQLNA